MTPPSTVQSSPELDWVDQAFIAHKNDDSFIDEAFSPYQAQSRARDIDLSNPITKALYLTRIYADLARAGHPLVQEPDRGKIAEIGTAFVRGGVSQGLQGAGGLAQMGAAAM